ncbi:TIGR01212 family radical SAM protein [Lachnoclostridium sp.]|uniref:TIGR01212 family radical SAM protein n=1 Tax=Lachnoclostridium sp. TaxID=2028282 RepID=UPI002899F47B|nr:TIGR01212 family radical SAM protein [Lachnoclostridium sp.]
MNLLQDKRYYSLDTYYKEQFGDKVYKLSLNGGMTCPNRDGTLGTGGCIFCSSGGSGDFATSMNLSITEQIEAAKELVANKAKSNRYVAYFQAYTNTYAPVDYLRSIFTEAMDHEEIVALSIATRPDCLPDEVLMLLSDLNQRKPIYIELGLQTIHENSAKLIRRGYNLPVFEDALDRLSNLNIPVVVHVILGLPGETKEMMLSTIDYLAKLPIHGIKLQLMHILKNTDLEDLYRKDPTLFSLLQLEDYINILSECLEHLPPHIVIHRITGDGPKNLLVAPLWSGNKRHVLNTIQKELKVRNSYQGKYIRTNLE